MKSGRGLMETLIAWLQEASFWQAVLALLGENVLILVLAVGGGQWLVNRYAARRVALPPHPLAGLEVAVTVSSVLLNTVVTILGLCLWRAGIIHFRIDYGIWACVDV